MCAVVPTGYREIPLPEPPDGGMYKQLMWIEEELIPALEARERQARMAEVNHGHGSVATGAADAYAKTIAALRRLF